MNWDITDFVVFIALLGGVGFLLWKAFNSTESSAYKWACGVALVAAFLLVWVNGAVGIIGDANNDANMLYIGVAAIGVFGAIIVRFQARGLAWTLCAVALAQTLVAIVAISADLGATGPVWPRDVLVLTAFFTTLWLLSAWLFQKSTRG